MKHVRPSIPWFLILLAVPACGGDSGGDADAPPSVTDAVVQPMPDAAPPDGGPASELLIGTWRQLPSTFDGEPPPPPELRSVLTLADDGTYTVVDEDETEAGTYTADDRTITVTGEDESGPYALSLDYLATADRLMLGALFPVGTADGTVGLWHGEAVFDGAAITHDLELRADNTAHYERHVVGGDSEVYDGTWSYVLEDVVFTTMIETVTVNVHYKEIRGEAIGGPLYERITPGERAAPMAPGRGFVRDVPILAPLR
jgi:hypothetical protein